MGRSISAATLWAAAMAMGSPHRVRLRCSELRSSSSAKLYAGAPHRCGVGVAHICVRARVRHPVGVVLTERARRQTVQTVWPPRGPTRGRAPRARAFGRGLSPIPCCVPPPRFVCDGRPFFAPFPALGPRAYLRPARARGQDAERSNREIGMAWDGTASLRSPARPSRDGKGGACGRRTLLVAVHGLGKATGLGRVHFGKALHLLAPGRAHQSPRGRRGLRM